MTGRTILVIDDEPGYRSMLDFLLTPKGYRILSACDGEAGLALLREHKIDLILTDMRMPKRDGLDTVVEIKKLTPHIPIILMTGYAVEDRLTQALQMKASACLRKPFDFQELTQALEAVLA